MFRLTESQNVPNFDNFYFYNCIFDNTIVIPTFLSRPNTIKTMINDDWKCLTNPDTTIGTTRITQRKLFISGLTTVFTHLIISK